MFQEYVDQVTQAVENSEKIELEYGKKREVMVLNIKEKLESELEYITKSVELKNYSPVEYYNKMTGLIHEFEKIKIDELKEIEAIKRSLHNNLSQIMNIDEPVYSEKILKKKISGMKKVKRCAVSSHRVVETEQGLPEKDVIEEVLETLDNDE